MKDNSFFIVYMVFNAALLYGLYRLVKHVLFPPPGPQMFCMMCGVSAPTRRSTLGSFGVEIILWLFFVIPGLIYSVWRRSTRAWACTNCGSRSVVPPHSPAALRASAGTY